MREDDLVWADDKRRQLIERVAAQTPHCAAHHVELVYSYSEGAFGWTCRLLPATRGRKTLRPTIEGYGATEGEAVASALEAVARWKDPAASATQRQKACALVLFQKMRDAGDITDEQLAAMTADELSR